jgi:hypothetical protein
MTEDEKADGQTGEEEKTPEAPLSRRDFLRRAGRDTVEKGLEMTPGRVVTRTILGDEKKGEAPIWTRFANWRKSKEAKKEQATSGTPIIGGGGGEKESNPNNNNHEQTDPK